VPKYYLPLLNKIDGLLKAKDHVAVAVDGNSAAGKSSLAAVLAASYNYNCNIIAMDDFFLRQPQRTPERLEEPGGNIDYERFIEDVVKPYLAGGRISYRKYCCRTGEMSEYIALEPQPLYLFEGAYSLHPRFGDGVYDIKVFLRLGEDEQRRRLQERDPGMLERFIKEWIPMENRYFEYFEIPVKCDFIF